MNFKNLALLAACMVFVAGCGSSSDDDDDDDVGNNGGQVVVPPGQDDPRAGLNDEQRALTVRVGGNSELTALQNVNAGNEIGAVAFQPLRDAEDRLTTGGSM